MITYPISEVLDRISICRLKVERIGEPQCQKELEYLEQNLGSYSFLGLDVQRYIKRLYDINARIWDLEANIRKGKDENLGLEEIGRRAILVRDYNKLRVSIKNEIVRTTEMGFEDVKVNHISE